MDRQARLMGNRRADMRGLNEGVIMNASNSRFHERRKIQSRRDHNLPRNGNDLPKKRFASDEVAKAQAEVLQGVFGNLKSPAKEMARETGLNERACRNQIAGLNSMNLADFFNACQAIPELQAWGAMMMGLSPSDPQFAKELARGHREIVLRIEGGNLTLGGGGENG
ncbi:hypothetical protein [uncultured Devosia sp.]|uniref:hypothetical protein n=1 Tax=uncultured Devosia sp. TaxID=211434 RepID=UPI00261AA8C6|nr:hypothetical protein [uncultured Devosia sp.]